MKPTLLLPKGRLYKELKILIESLHVTMPHEDTRKYFYSEWQPDCSLFIAKPKAVPQLLYSKIAEFGFCGTDIVNNSEYKDDVYPLLKTGLNKVKICLCSKLDKNTLFSLNRPIIVATEYEIVASEYFTSLGVPHYIINTTGSTEGYLDLKADCIIDVVDTGKTLEENNINILEVLFESETTLYAHNDMCDAWLPKIICNLIR